LLYETELRQNGNMVLSRPQRGEVTIMVTDKSYVGWFK